jgi:hypothetical protein
MDRTLALDPLAHADAIAAAQRTEVMKRRAARAAKRDKDGGEGGPDRIWRGELYTTDDGRLALTPRAKQSADAWVTRKLRSKCTRTVHDGLQEKMRAHLADGAQHAELVGPMFAWAHRTHAGLRTIVSQGRIFFDDGQQISYVGTLSDALAAMHRAMFPAPELVATG